MPRLFVAIDPPEAVRRQLQALQRGLPGARWTSPQQLHLTLHFLGEQPLEPTRAALAGVQAERFALSIAGVGVFPPRGSAHVLWAGMPLEPPLRSLHTQLAEALEVVGYVPEKRAFHPHITLARFRAPPNHDQLRAYQQRHATLSIAPFPVDSFVLYSSVLEPSGSTYTAEGIYPLR